MKRQENSGNSRQAMDNILYSAHVYGGSSANLYTYYINMYMYIQYILDSIVYLE